MGISSSQAAATATEYPITDEELRNAPHNYYLVYGSPSIRFARDRVRGPLIYDVDIEYDEETDEVERTATLDLSSAVPQRQKFELVASPAASSSALFNPVQSLNGGLALTFRVAAASPPVSVRVWTGVTIDYCVGEGLRLRSGDPARASPRCVFATTATADLDDVTTRAEIYVRQLREVGLEETTQAGSAHARQRVVYAPIVIEVDLGETDQHVSTPPVTPREKKSHKKPESRATRSSLLPSPLPSSNPPTPPPPPCRKKMLQYTFLDVPAEAVTTATTAAAAAAATAGGAAASGPPRIACKVVKQLLQVGCEVYELEDVFDVGREDDEVVNPVVDPDDDDDNDLCAVCLTNPKNTTLLPCRHMCMCNECAAQLRLATNRCPMCRANIERVMVL